MSKKESSGEAVSLRGVSLTPVFTALFKPSAELLGKELRNTIKEMIDERKTRRREENLQAHIDAVRIKLSSQTDEPNEATTSFIEQPELFSEWVENVQEIDPRDVEISNLWQNLLACSRCNRKNRLSRSIVCP